jgi:hypothetical protein
MTLGNMRSLGVRSLAVSCILCHHAARLDVDGYTDDATVPSFGPRMVCTSCAIRRRPAELARTNRKADLDGHAMAKLKMPSDAAKALP